MNKKKQENFPALNIIENALIRKLQFIPTFSFAHLHTFKFAN